MTGLGACVVLLLVSLHQSRDAVIAAHAAGPVTAPPSLALPCDSAPAHQPVSPKGDLPLAPAAEPCHAGTPTVPDGGGTPPPWTKR